MVGIVTVRGDVYLYRDNDDPTITTVGDASIYEAQQSAVGQATMISSQGAVMSMPVNTGNTISVDDFLTTYGSSA